PGVRGNRAAEDNDPDPRRRRQGDHLPVSPLRTQTRRHRTQGRGPGGGGSRGASDMSQRRGVDGGDGLTSVDLLEEIRAALDGLEPLLLGRMVDIEMPRLRVLTDPTLCRRLLAQLIGYAVAHSEPPDSN